MFFFYILTEKVVSGDVSFIFYPALTLHLNHIIFCQFCDKLFYSSIKLNFSFYPLIVFPAVIRVRFCTFLFFLFYHSNTNKKNHFFSFLFTFIFFFRIIFIFSVFKSIFSITLRFSKIVEFIQWSAFIPIQ